MFIRCTGENVLDVPGETDEGAEPPSVELDTIRVYTMYQGKRHFIQKWHLVIL